MFFIAFYTAPFSSKLFFLGLFVRSLSTQLFFLVVLLLLLLSMTAFSYVGLLSRFWVRLFHALYLSHLPPGSFLEGLSFEQFAELGSYHLLAFPARARSLAFLSSVTPFLTISRSVFIYLVLLGGLFLGLSLFSNSVDFSYLKGFFSYSSQGFFVDLLLPRFSFLFCLFSVFFFSLFFYLVLLAPSS